MEHLIYPEIFGSKVKAFFTGKAPGVEQDKIAGIASLERRGIYMPIQKHTDKVVILESDFDLKIADAVITNGRGLLIGIQVADCVPILLHDIKNHVVGAVHAGWRGTAEGILKNTIKTMTDKFYSESSDIVLAIGPSIRWCCYNVGYEVIEAVSKATDLTQSAGCGMRDQKEYYMKKGEKYCLDLQSSNKYQALSVGVPEKNIWLSGECTFCLPDKYYSYRFAKGSTGRQGGFIGIV